MRLPRRDGRKQLREVGKHNREWSLVTISMLSSICKAEQAWLSVYSITCRRESDGPEDQRKGLISPRLDV